MAVLNPGHGKTCTGITSSSPAIPHARILARLPPYRRLRPGQTITDNEPPFRFDRMRRWASRPARSAPCRSSQLVASDARDPDIVHAHQITRHTTGSKAGRARPSGGRGRRRAVGR